LVIPAFTDNYPLKLKNNDILRFIEQEDSIYLHKYCEFFTPMKVYQGLFTGVPMNTNEYKKVYHTVRQGETLVTIANKYGLSVLEIRKMNNLGSNTLKTKQKLLVGFEILMKPDNIPAEDQKNEIRTTYNQENNDPEIYIVKKGDSLSSIAAKFGTTARKMANYNNITDINTLSIGQKLKIPQ